MSKKIAFANHKGGVGKTITAIETAYRLAKQGAKTLLVDCDAQGNASLTLGKKDPLEFSPEETLHAFFATSDEIPSLEKIATQSDYKNLYYIPNNIDVFEGISKLPATSIRKYFALKMAYERDISAFDYIIFDTPPSLEGVLLSNALIVADYVVIPIESESVYALRGIKNLLNAIKVINLESTKKTEVLGYLLTKYDGRTKAAKILHTAIGELYGTDMLFNTGIPKSTKVSQAVMMHSTICEIEPDGSVCKSYKTFITELLTRIDNKE